MTIATPPHGSLDAQPTISVAATAQPERWLAYALALLLPVPLLTVSSLRVGNLLVIVFLPILVRPFRDNRPAFRRLALIPLAAIGGLSLAGLSSLSTDRAWDAALAFEHFALLLNFGCQLVGIFWAATTVGLRRTILLYALSAVLLSTFALPDDLGEAWKYSMAWPVCALVLAYAGKWPEWVRFVALVGLASVALWAQSRNNAGVLVLAALISIVPAIRGRLTWPRTLLAIGFLCALFFGAFYVVNAAIAAGTFGSEIQARHAEQSGSGLLGARIEYGAALGLFSNDPLGLGAGIQPSLEDRAVARAGLYDIGVVPNTDYIRAQVLGRSLELHSVGADLWLFYGLPGLALAVCAGTTFVMTVVRSMSGAGAMKHLCLFLALQGLWDLLFSPYHANGAWVAAAMGALLAVQKRLKGNDSREVHSS